MGIAVPQELSICGIDNHELGTETNPALTTIALPTQDLRRIAVAQVSAALAGEPIAQQSLLPFQLLMRGTTGCASKKLPTPLTPTPSSDSFQFLNAA